MTNRIVIAGAEGQVGRVLAGEALRRGCVVRALTRRQLDITDLTDVRSHIQSGDMVVNCAAFTNVDESEAHPEVAFAVNATGPGNLARACAEVDARLVHISTDYVFDGGLFRPYDVTDATGPLSVYGKSKLAGEFEVLHALPGAQIVRTSWVYTGTSGSDFVAVMRKLAETDRFIDVVDDQIGSPTYVNDLVGSLMEIAFGEVQGPILHAANAGAVSRCDQARAVFAELGADPQRVRPVSTAEFPRPAQRPIYSALSMSGSVEAGLTQLRPWRDALAEALAAPGGGGQLPSTT